MDVRTDSMQNYILMILRIAQCRAVKISTPLEVKLGYNHLFVLTTQYKR